MLILSINGSYYSYMSHFVRKVIESNKLFAAFFIKLLICVLKNSNYECYFLSIKKLPK